jgi:hypothetical protein
MIGYCGLLPITARELEALGEYSCSLPSAWGETAVGKRWKRDLRAYDRSKVGWPPEWLIGEYVRDPEVPRGEVGIRWYTAALVHAPSLVL